LISLTLKPSNCGISIYHKPLKYKTTDNKGDPRMLEIENHGLIQTLSLVALAIIALSVGIQKLLKDWKSTNAETNIISIMHTELERLSTQNTVLSTELNRLQQEMIKLNAQLAQLCIDNQILQAEVVTLTDEINKLRTLQVAIKKVRGA
jgi:dynactin complex subunit